MQLMVGSWRSSRRNRQRTTLKRIDERVADSAHEGAAQSERNVPHSHGVMSNYFSRSLLRKHVATALIMLALFFSNPDRTEAEVGTWAGVYEGQTSEHGIARITVGEDNCVPLWSGQPVCSAPFPYADIEFELTNSPAYCPTSVGASHVRIAAAESRVRSSIRVTRPGINRDGLFDHMDSGVLTVDATWDAFRRIVIGTSELIPPPGSPCPAHIFQWRAASDDWHAAVRSSATFLTSGPLVPVSSSNGRGVAALSTNDFGTGIAMLYLETAEPTCNPAIIVTNGIAFDAGASFATTIEHQGRRIQITGLVGSTSISGALDLATTEQCPQTVFQYEFPIIPATERQTDPPTAPGAATVMEILPGHFTAPADWTRKQDWSVALFTGGTARELEQAAITQSAVALVLEAGGMRFPAYVGIGPSNPQLAEISNAFPAGIPPMTRVLLYRVLTNFEQR